MYCVEVLFAVLLMTEFDLGDLLALVKQVSIPLPISRIFDAAWQSFVVNLARRRT
jgi:hypothetical protein